MTQPDLDRPVRYRARSFGSEGEARMRVWYDQAVAMLTELDSNPGPSITNAAEDAWAVVAAVTDLKILHPSWRLVEHYPANAHRSDALDVVSFAGLDADGRPQGVSWCPAILVPGLAWLRGYVVFHGESAPA